MNAARVCFLAVALAGLALGLVHLRAEQTRGATRLLRLESQWIALRREWWALQTRAARLRAPERITRQVRCLQTGLVPPLGEEPPRLANVVPVSNPYPAGRPQE